MLVAKLLEVKTNDVVEFAETFNEETNEKALEEKLEAYDRVDKKEMVDIIGMLALDVVVEDEGMDI